MAFPEFDADRSRHDPDGGHLSKQDRLRQPDVLPDDHLQERQRHEDHGRQADFLSRELHRHRRRVRAGLVSQQRSPSQRIQFFQVRVRNIKF